MNVFHFLKNKSLIVGMVVFALLASFLAIPAGVVAAQSPDPTRTPRLEQAKEAAEREMSYALQREQNWLARQQLHINQGDQAVVRIQNLIDSAAAEGKDVSSLQAALSALQSQLATAKEYHAQADSILAAHNGFDGSGAVTDRAAAHQTLLDGRNALRSAHLALQKGYLDMRLALQAWRSAQS